MQHRKSGRPSGTDGSDFSYRMVVDSRYTKVAKGKSRLKALILTQAACQLIALLYVILSLSRNDPNPLAVSSSAIGFISLLSGELGRRRSRAIFLRVYMLTSTIAVIISMFCAITSSSALEVIQNPRDWDTKKFEFIETFVAVLGLLVQIFAISTVISLISNMSPPKKAS